MTVLYSEEEVVTRITRLTHAQLVSYVEAQIVKPMRSEQGPVYGQMELVRLELLCDLSEQFELDEDALGLVISLIDQLHGVRAELRSFVEAVGREPEEVRERVRKAVLENRSGA